MSTDEELLIRGVATKRALIEQYHAQTAPYFSQINAIYLYRQFFHLTDQEQSAVNALHASIQLISDQLFNSSHENFHTHPIN